MVHLAEQELDTFFALLLVRDIGVRAEPHLNLAVFAADRVRPGEEPAELAVLAAQREGVFPDFPFLQRVQEVLGRPRLMFRVMYGAPAMSEGRGFIRAGVFVPALIVPEYLTLRI